MASKYFVSATFITVSGKYGVTACIIAVTRAYAVTAALIRARYFNYFVVRCIINICRWIIISNILHSCHMSVNVLRPIVLMVTT